MFYKDLFLFFALLLVPMRGCLATSLPNNNGKTSRSSVAGKNNGKNLNREDNNQSIRCDVAQRYRMDEEAWMREQIRLIEEIKLREAKGGMVKKKNQMDCDTRASMQVPSNYLVDRSRKNNNSNSNNYNSCEDYSMQERKQENTTTIGEEDVEDDWMKEQIRLVEQMKKRDEKIVEMTAKMAEMNEKIEEMRERVVQSNNRNGIAEECEGLNGNNNNYGDNNTRDYSDGEPAECYQHPLPDEEEVGMKSNNNNSTPKYVVDGEGNQETTTYSNELVYEMMLIEQSERLEAEKAEWRKQKKMEREEDKNRENRRELIADVKLVALRINKINSTDVFVACEREVKKFESKVSDFLQQNECKMLELEMERVKNSIIEKRVRYNSQEIKDKFCEMVCGVVTILEKNEIKNIIIDVENLKKAPKLCEEKIDKEIATSLKLYVNKYGISEMSIGIPDLELVKSNYGPDRGEPIMFYLFWFGLRWSIEVLIDAGVNLEIASRCGIFYYAVALRWYDMAYRLIDAMADINYKGYRFRGCAPIHLCVGFLIEFSENNFIGMPLEKRSLTIKGLEKIMPEIEMVELADRLIKAGADVNCKIYGDEVYRDELDLFSAGDTETSLFIARFERRFCDLFYGDSLLHIVARLGFTKMIDRLICANADIYCKNKKGYTPFHLAVEVGAMETVEHFIFSCKVDINCMTGGSLPWEAPPNRKLFYPTVPEHIRILNICNLTPLHIAILLGKMKVVSRLIKARADVNCRTESQHIKGFNGYTPLHLVAKFGEVELADLLILHNAIVNIRDSSSNTALHFAAKRSSVEIVDRLLLCKEIMEHIDSRNEYGFTALHVATKSGSVEIVDRLLTFGANVNCVVQPEEVFIEFCKKHFKSSPNEEGFTPLHFAASMSGKEELIDRLILSEANVNSRDKLNDTPLHIAVIYEEVEVAKRLIHAGAKVNALNKAGRSPLDFLEKKYYLDVDEELGKMKKLLIDAGAKPNGSGCVVQ